MKQHKILVAIPAYNCEKQVSRVLAGFDDKLLSRISKVIVIDDRGGDNTAAVAQAAIDELKLPQPKVEVVQNDRNLGLGGSHKMAFLYGEKTGMDYVAILHGDDQAKTPELNELIDQIEAQPELGAVLGCRFMKGSRLRGYSWERIWGNRVINVAYSIVAMRKSLDLGSGLNLFRLSDLADHRYLGFDDRMTFNIDLLLDYYSKKTLLKFYPITWTEEDQVTNARNMSVAKRALAQLARWRVGRLPLDKHDVSEYTCTPYKQNLENKTN
jgi:dolichol-phosphate mannosyltransferase